jgi:hypothetical protein
VAEASEHVLRFDWDDVARRTRELYRGLLAAASGGRAAPEQGRGPERERRVARHGH